MQGRKGNAMRWIVIAVVVVAMLSVGAIFDNPDGVDPLGTSVILDDGTPF